VPTAILQRRTLSMQPPQLSMKPLTNNLAIPHDHGSNQRIRTHMPAPAPSKLQRPPQMSLIRACQLRIHQTD
jgi:hypothetical protein